MIQMETVLLLAEHLGHATEGVNAKLAELTLRPTHAMPPDVALIATPYDNDQCAKFEAPSRFPALFVLPDGPVPSEPEVGTIYRDSDVAVAIRYIVRDSNAAKNNVAAAITMKAIERSMLAFLDDTAYGRQARGEDSGFEVFVITAEEMAYGPWREAVGEAMAIQAFTLMMKVRDRAP